MELTVGAVGAVTSVDGKSFATGGTPSGDLGGIVRDGVGQYTVTLPGRGGVQKIMPFQPVILDGAAADAKVPLLNARTPASRTFQFTFLDQLTAAAEELTSGTVVLFQVLVNRGTIK